MFNQTELVYNIYYLLDGFDSTPNNYKIKKKTNPYYTNSIITIWLLIWFGDY